MQPLLQVNWGAIPALVARHPRLVIVFPRRCGKTQWLARYLDRHGDTNSAYIGLTADMTREFSRLLLRPRRCVPSHRYVELAAEQVAPPTLYIDEILFCNLQRLLPLCERQRVFGISSHSPDEAHVVGELHAAGFTVMDAPLM